MDMDKVALDRLADDGGPPSPQEPEAITTAPVAAVPDQPAAAADIVRGLRHQVSALVIALEPFAMQVRQMVEFGALRAPDNFQFRFMGSLTCFNVGHCREAARVLREVQATEVRAHAPGVKS